MSQQNGGTPPGQEPWLDQDSTSATPHVFPFGAPARGDQDPSATAAGGQEPAQGSQPQQWGQPQYDAQPQQWGQQDPYAQPGSQPQQWGQPQYDAQPQQWGQQDPYAQQGSQPQHGAQPQQWGQQDPYAQQGSHPQQWDQPQYGQQPAADQGNQWGQAAPQDQAFGSGPQHPQPVGQEQGSQGQGSQQFSGILDPHTGEIHPVPDLQNLDETDALLVVVSGPDAGAQILLDTDVVTVGRSPNADIFLDDVTVSRKHAEFVRTPSGFTLRDTGSLNGTYVGRQLIDSIELQNGADVQIGKFRMIFQQRPRTS